MPVDEIERIKLDGDEAKLAGVQLYIDPDICIDCGACEPECPVEAIFEEWDVPEEWEDYIDKNAAFFEG
jgi:NAD-dependent dihydropyrimidine dehydrogenase PreA subunit